LQQRGVTVQQRRKKNRNVSHPESENSDDEAQSENVNLTRQQSMHGNLPTGRVGRQQRYVEVDELESDSGTSIII
jgi:hypothetical protein